MITRPYGKTGIEISVVGFGGIICMGESVSEASGYVARAIERGINYFDVAPSYGDAQEILGPALKPYRKDVFLACKTGKRTAAEAKEELDGSLAALKTDYFDLYQFHAVTTLEEVETIFAPGGAMEVFEEAQKAGIIRFLGFSAHSEVAAIELMNRFDFTSVLFPINWVTWNIGKFGPRVVATALETDTAVLALKSMARRPWEEHEERAYPKCWYCPIDSYEEARFALRFTLSRPVVSAVSPGYPKFLWWACDAADNFRSLSETEEQEIAQRAEAQQPIFRKE